MVVFELAVPIVQLQLRLDRFKDLVGCDLALVCAACAYDRHVARRVDETCGFWFFDSHENGGKTLWIVLRVSALLSDFLQVELLRLSLRTRVCSHHFYCCHNVLDLRRIVQSLGLVI